MSISEVLFVFAFHSIALDSYLEKYKHVIHQPTYTKQDTYIYNPHEQINLNYNPTNLKQY
jgi:hypothetical protein